MGGGGVWKLKIYVLLYEYNSWSIARWQIKFGTAEDSGRRYKFNLKHIAWRSL
jgi:hypothetical protein